MDPWTILGWILVIIVVGYALLWVAALLFATFCYSIEKAYFSIRNYLRYRRSKNIEPLDNETWYSPSVLDRRNRTRMVVRRGDRYYAWVPGMAFDTREDWLKFIKSRKAYLTPSRIEKRKS